MARYGPQFGPDITFLGVARCDWADPATYPGADVVILGAPFDGGTASLANRVVLEALSALARKRLDGAGTSWDPGRPLLDGR